MSSNGGWTDGQDETRALAVAELRVSCRRRWGGKRDRRGFVDEGRHGAGGQGGKVVVVVVVVVC